LGTRPILVLRKFNQFIFVGIPLSTAIKKNKYRITFSFIEGVLSDALLSQMRTLDPKRLVKKMGMIGKNDYSSIIKAVREMF
jgi:mRNA-degrading endonuclease toxin of MazEF toxin-antitoxin module